jgi:hypothetical protein
MNLPIGADLTHESFRAVRDILRKSDKTYKNDPVIKEWVQRADVRLVHEEVSAVDREKWIAEHGDSKFMVKCTHCGNDFELTYKTAESSIEEHTFGIVKK